MPNDFPEIDSGPPPFVAYDVEGVGTVIAHEPEGYVVRMLDGRVCGYPAAFGETNEANAAPDIAYAIANPPVIVAPVPDAIRSAALRYWLNAAGLRAAVEAAVAAADQDTRDAWAFEINIRRDHPLVVQLGAALGLTSAQIDDAFRAAALL